MTTTEDKAMVRRDYTLAELGRRIQLNAQSGWGLEGGTSAQLNLLALYCQRFRLLPGEEVTLYQGHPYITIDGRVTLMRRHPEYRGHRMRPLSKDEKLEWGYDEGDIVVEATIRTLTNGEIVGHGKVSAAERRGNGRNPVAAQHPVEMAQKRALSRAERFAFGTDSILDEDEAEEQTRIQVQERSDPARVKANAAKHAEIFDGEDTWAGEPIATPDVKVGDPLADELAGLIETASANEVPFDDCRVSLPAPVAQVQGAVVRLQTRLDEAMAEAADG